MPDDECESGVQRQSRHPDITIRQYADWPWNCETESVGLIPRFGKNSGNSGLPNSSSDPEIRSLLGRLDGVDRETRQAFEMFPSNDVVAYAGGFGAIRAAWGRGAWAGFFDLIMKGFSTKNQLAAPQAMDNSEATTNSTGLPQLGHACASSC